MNAMSSDDPCYDGEIRTIGCCGAYCKTCPPFTSGYCKGCKLGYEDGKRDITRAKCEIKVCCFINRKLETCADCPEYGCDILANFWGKNGQKYTKYRESTEFIQAYGYSAFIEKAVGWKRAYGKL